jgi:hypothetical protein
LYINATSDLAGALREVIDGFHITYWFWYAYSASGTQLQLDPLPACPVSSPLSQQYTATATTLTYFSQDAACGTDVRVYTKQ